MYLSYYWSLDYLDPLGPLSNSIKLINWLMVFVKLVSWNCVKLWFYTEVGIFINKFHGLDIFIKIHLKPKLENKPNPSWTRVSSFWPHIHKMHERKNCKKKHKSVTRKSEEKREREFGQGLRKEERKSFLQSQGLISHPGVP